MTKQTEALRMAIEALETAEIQSEYDGLSNLIFKAIQACKEALAQPTAEQSSLVQEPVAWMNDIAFSMDKELLGTRGRIVPLYTTPPSREWVGLSDDEIGRLAVFDGLHHIEIPLLAKFIIAIEQALKEKNNG